MGRQRPQKSSPNGVRWMLRRTVCAAAAPSASPRARPAAPRAPGSARVLERLAREPDQPEPVEVVEVGRHAVGIAAAGLGADHRQARARRARRRSPSGRAAAHVDRRLRALERQQAQDARLVGRELVEDPLVGGVGVLARSGRRRSGAAARRRARAAARPPSLVGRARLDLAVRARRACRGCRGGGARSRASIPQRASRDSSALPTRAVHSPSRPRVASRIRSQAAAAPTRSPPPGRAAVIRRRPPCRSLGVLVIIRRSQGGRSPRRNRARRRGVEQPLVLRIAERSISEKSRGGHLAHALGDELAHLPRSAGG